MNKHRFSIGFSPCPNDTFIFDALVNNKIDVSPFTFDVHLEDVETLNQWAIEGKLDISKVSFGVYPHILHQYELLNSGSALGKGVGPLLISKKEINDLDAKIDHLTIALPGKNTTAHLLFSSAFPSAHHKRFVLFSEIEDAVLNGDVDLGVIIHENRFTYQQKGLKKLMDLGDYWEQKTGLPIPLGGIVVKNNFDAEIKTKIDRLIRQSLELAFVNYPELPPYVRENSQEMNEDVMRKHIDLYVNDFSLGLGPVGKKAIEKFILQVKHPDPHLL
ncbi:MAG TPA: 1,4-dihydroxy-6-naphthoate synthase [Chitinophagaceae bacterium]|nr:1,4-dihydroxy-6-naphthoate synthase [Chitinophagaceae bacterium]